MWVDTSPRKSPLSVGAVGGSATRAADAAAPVGRPWAGGVHPRPPQQSLRRLDSCSRLSWGSQDLPEGGLWVCKTARVSGTRPAHVSIAEGVNSVESVIGTERCLAPLERKSQWTDHHDFPLCPHCKQSGFPDFFFFYSVLSDFSLPELLIEGTEPDYIFAVSNWHFQL